jgi:flagellar P-ring protein precursor FlgI
LFAIHPIKVVIMKTRLVFKCFLALVLLLNASFGWAERLKDMAVVAGQRPNQLIGYGLVVGLDGTGDGSGANPVTGQTITTMLNSLGVSIPPGINLQSRNAAAVMVTAELAALARPGQAMDITVSSLANARSLRGGTLLMTPLRAANGQVYGQAQGSVVIPGASASTNLARTTVNQLSSGRIPGGAIVEQAAPEADLNPLIEFNFHKADYVQTKRAVDAMQRVLTPADILPIDARTVSVRVPVDRTQRMNVMAQLLELDIQSSIDLAKVVFNARTGSVVVNQSVRLAPFAVTHGNQTIRVQSTNQVVQPSLLSRGRPMNQRNDQVSIEQGPAGQMIQVGEGASLEQVVRALNMLGATPQDLMSILQAMKSAGALLAELEVI